MDNKLDGVNFQNNLNNNLNNTEKNTIGNISNTPEQIKVDPSLNLQKENIQNIDQKNINEIKENINKTDQIKEDDIKNSSTTTAKTYVDDKKIHMSEVDLEMEKQIEDILSSDLSNFYESLNQKDKDKFKQDQYELSINIIVALKSAAGNIKKAIKTIFNSIYKWMNSLRGIRNRAFIEKSTKLKVEKILQTQDNSLNK
ncbi:MAG: hypothetical protein QMB51_02325 [Patescibacteria group bacterium]